jgi:acyl-CoA synthetase (NDP forming)
MNLNRFTPLFKARSLALVGASNDPRKWGQRMLNNLLNGGYRGDIYPVNPTEDKILGLPVYKSVVELPSVPDLAVIVVPPPAVLPTVQECVALGVKAGIIITAGFAELGGEGARQQKLIVETARQGGMVLVGPNCNGFMSPWENLYVQFPSFYVPPGPLAIIAQSGNVMDVLARQIMISGLGCSVTVASGNEADLHVEDYLEYLAEDPQTEVILSYIEGFKDGRRFFDTASLITRRKPIVMLKAGKTSSGAIAAASHTASIAGSDHVFQAACRQAGVIRASSLDEMLNIGYALLRQPLPQGRRVAIVTGGGGWGVMAADICEEMGFDVTSLPGEVIRELDKLLPAWWNRGNPVDLVAGSTTDNIFKAVETLLQSNEVDSVIMLSLMPALKVSAFGLSREDAASEAHAVSLRQAMVEAVERFTALAERYRKPVICATEQIFATAVQEAHIRHELGRHRLACYHMPHQAAAVLRALTGYGMHRNNRA